MMARSTCMLMLVLLVSQSAVAQQSPRQEFVDRISQLRPGMHIDQVREILGEPDDVRTWYDPGGLRTRDTRQIWAYGTNGHLTFPALGQVHINWQDRVQNVYGGRAAPGVKRLGLRTKSDPPSPELFPEDELRDLLRTIDRAPGSHNDRKVFHSLDMIQIVNTLQPLGDPVGG